MSVEMLYVVENAEFRVSLHDDIFERLCKKHPRECEVVFGVEEPNELTFDAPKAVVARSDLLAAIDSLLAAFKDDPDLSPRRYVFDFDIIPGLHTEGDTEVNGVRLPGKEGCYHLLGGIDQCVLREVYFGEQLPVYKNPVDVRDKTDIETESHGPIQIRSTKKRSPLAGELRALRKFLQSQSGEAVIKLLC